MTLGPTSHNVLAFRHVAVHGGATLRPVVDGVDLLAGYRNDRGVDPDRLLPPLSSALLPTGCGRRVVIGSCGCGETGCGSLSMQVRRDGGDVVWEPAETGRRESIRARYRFALEPYLDAIDRAAPHRPGEGRGRRVARALMVRMRESGDVTGDNPPRPPCVDWVGAFPCDSTGVQGSVTVGGEQHVYDIDPLPGESDDEFGERVLRQLDDALLTLLGFPYDDR